MRHLIRSRAATNRIFSRKDLLSSMHVQHVLSYHLIYLPEGFYRVVKCVLSSTVPVWDGNSERVVHVERQTCTFKINVTAFDLKIWLSQVKLSNSLYPCVPISKLPSYINTMIVASERYDVELKQLIIYVAYKSTYMLNMSLLTHISRTCKFFVQLYIQKY